MRHNNNGRRFRGRDNRNGGGGHNQGTQHHHHSNSGGGGGNHNNGGRRINPRMQTFDSNGPEVRIRGNAYQIHEKYVTLARDATSSGDPVLAESYQQHAEHYQRMINEMTEEYNKHNPPQQFQQQQPVITGDEPQPELSVEQPQSLAAAQQQAQQQPPVADGGMEDLDQGFLRGPRTKEVETA